MYLDTGARNVCLTGGEPFIQHTQSLIDLAHILHAYDYQIEMFSNGTIEYPEEFAADVNIVMDWKLPGSGEYGKFAEAVSSNVNLLRLSERHSIKFTVSDLHDLQTAKEAYDSVHLGFAHCQVFVGPVWGKIDPQVIVEFVRANKLPWRLTLQVHKYVYDPEARGI